MPLDPRVRSAICEATLAKRQTQSLANKIIAWFDAINSGNESITDRESVARHVELLYRDAQKAEAVEDDDEDEDEEDA